MSKASDYKALQEAAREFLERNEELFVENECLMDMYYDVKDNHGSSSAEMKKFSTQEKAWTDAQTKLKDLVFQKDLVLPGESSEHP